MERFTELRAWQRSHALVLEVYRVTARFPADERTRLTARLRRAVRSVPVDIVEGSKCHGHLEYARHLDMAEASLAEMESLILESRDRNYVEARAAAAVLESAGGIARMLHTLRTTMESVS